MLDTPTPDSNHFVFLVHTVSATSAGLYGLTGIVASGSVKLGDEVRITSSGQCANVVSIATALGPLSFTHSGQTISLELSSNIKASNGDVISLRQLPLEMTDQFEATIVWVGGETGLMNYSYVIELAGQTSSASITSIKSKNLISTAHIANQLLLSDDVVICNLVIAKPLAFDVIANSKLLGSFTLSDRHTRSTVATGMINGNLRKAQNVHYQPLTICREDREKLNGHKGRVIWFTGLSGSGKSTIANALEVALYSQGKRTFILDGDNVRQGLNNDLSFTDADRVENIRRIAEVAKLMLNAGVIVITAFISPFRSEREMAKQLIGADNYVEVHVSTSLSLCEQRDPKGLYKKARKGLLRNMTGIDSAYEPPLSPQITIDTEVLSIEQSLQLLMSSI